VTFFLASLGQAYNDTHANTFVTSVRGAHRWLGFIHAMYMAGCLVGPFVATAVASANAHSKWNLFYIFPLGVGVINMVLVGLSFHDRMLLSPKRKSRSDTAESERESTGKTALKEIKATLSMPGVWLLSLYFFFFLGAGITSGGWMVEYLVNVRNGDIKDMGYVPAGYYGGGFLGRLLLAEPTHRLGERRMIFIYAVVCLGLQLVFWL
jgi:fucose permease